MNNYYRLSFGLITASIDLAVIFWLFKSTSAKTGFAPAVTIDDAVAKNVRDVVITSSLGCTPIAF